MQSNFAAIMLFCAVTMLARSSRWFFPQPACALVSSGALCSCPDGGACGADMQEREFGLWGTFRVVLFHGTKPAKRAALASIASGSSEVLITNYGTLRWVTLRTNDARKWALTS